MSRTETVEAIVLRSVDVGEADRFVILFTRELGRIAARVPASRRPGSSRACTLPSARVSLMLRTSSSGTTVTQATLMHSPITEPLAAFAVTSQALELLMQVLQEEDPQEELFEATESFLKNCQDDADLAFLSFGIRFLSHLGVLPDADEMPKGIRLEKEEEEFLQASLTNHILPPLTHDKGLRLMLRTILPTVLVSAPKSTAVAKALAGK